ncbi:unnamed protein product [Musa hybrid cultivar]
MSSSRRNSRKISSSWQTINPSFLLMLARYLINQLKGKKVWWTG